MNAPRPSSPPRKPPLARRGAAALLLAAALGLAGSAARAEVEYSVVDLGDLGGTNSEARGLNDLGQVVGWSKDALGRHQAFLWQSNNMAGLGFLSAGTLSDAYAINENGEVTGYSYVSPTNWHGFLYISNSLVDIGTLGGPSSWGYAINGQGDITGGAWNATPTNRACVWRSNQLIEILPAAGYRTCDGFGINDAGWISGETYIYSTSGRWWAYVWFDDNGNFIDDEGEMRLLGCLGTAGGEHSAAYDINDIGQAVGWSGITNTMFPRHAFLVTSTNGVWQDNGGDPNTNPTNYLMQGLGALESPTNNSYAYAINNQSWIVGMATTSSRTNQAFLWRDGVMTNLNDLIDPGSGWVLTNATDISEQNLIVGSGLHNGQVRAFILLGTPALSVLGTNGAAVADNEPPSLAKGTHFGRVDQGTSRTNTFFLRNGGATTFTISITNWSTNGPDASRFQIDGIPAAVEVGGVSNFTVVFSPATNRLYQASLTLESDAAEPQTLTLFAGNGVANQTIAFPPLPAQYLTNLVALSATASSGLPVAFTVASGPAAIDESNVLSFSGTGQVSIVASQPGDDNWNPAPDVTNAFAVTKVPASVALDDLEQTYDGAEKPVSASTDPEGLAVELTYDGNPWAPTNAGSYAVTGTVVDAIWEGSATGLLVVAKAGQTIDFPAISDQLITNLVPLSATAGSGFPVAFAVASGPAAIDEFNVLSFSGAGQVSIVASQSGDDNWNPAPDVTNAFAVTKVPASVALDDLEQTYDGAEKPVSASTVPEGLAVALTYDGNAWAPTNAGTYAVTGTIVDAIWEGSATGALVVARAAAAVFLQNLAQTYDGSARNVSATTVPEGLAVEFTYDGNPWAPTNAGTYAVTGAVAEANWEGSATGALVVGRANQTIDFPAIPDPFITNAIPLSATAGSGLPVAFAVASGPAEIDAFNVLTFSSTGLVSIVASQPGDANWNPAPDVTNRFAVYGLYELTVVSVHGVANPPPGVYTNLLGTVLTNSILVPEPAGGTQLVCSGWALAGHQPASGATTAFEMTVTNNATLVWLWATNFWLETAAGPDGRVDPSNSWQPAGLPAVIIAVPDRYYHFTHWTGSASGTNNPAGLVMDVPKSVQAFFAENLATNYTPEWWLAKYGWTNDFDPAALRDDEPDGFPTWQEYVADTDPTNFASRLRIVSIAAEDTNFPVVTWPASTGRVYQIHRADDLGDGPWITQQLFLGAGDWTDTNPPAPDHRFYRVAPLRP